MTPEHGGLTPTEINDLWTTFNALADAAQVETLRHFRSPDLVAESKRDDFDPVTIADRAAERAMRSVLAERHPDDGILGEEYGPQSGTSGRTWVLDPIDGTRAYISGAPTWGTLIALSREDGPMMGMIAQPYIGERFVGGPNRAELCHADQKTVLKTQAPRALSAATVLTTFPEVGTEEEGRAFHAVAGRAKLTRYGFDCYGYALLAGGHVDLVIEAGLAPYDIQAPIAVIEAAGGVVTDWNGGPAFNGGRALAAANPEIHAEAMAILQAEFA